MAKRREKTTVTVEFKDPDLLGCSDIEFSEKAHSLAGWGEYFTLRLVVDSDLKVIKAEFVPLGYG